MTKRIDKTQMEFLLDRYRRYGGRDPRWTALWKRLMAKGGQAVVFPLSMDGEPHLDELLSRRATFSKDKARMILGVRNECHGNACILESREGYKVGTGYALSPDGLWRQHSWAIDQDGRIVETTERRVAYYGFTMTAPEVKLFRHSLALAWGVPISQLR